MKNPRIARLRVYPIKSLDPVEVQEAEIGVRSLKDDRLFAMVDETGRYINGKRTGRVNQLKAEYDLSNRLVTLSERKGEEKETFELRAGNNELNEYLSNFFGINLTLMENTQGEFMDIPSISSVTIVSEASLKSLQQDFNNHTLEDLRLRFRTNIEIADVDAYWEEKLFGIPDVGMRFRVGNVEMIGVSPRARCNVPPQHPFTGELDKTFVRKMIESRNNNLPADSTLLQHGRNTYYLTVNVYVPDHETGKHIKVNDYLEIKEAVNLRM